jgi:triacylglycerol lipase
MSETITLEVHPSQLEVDRAITAYIPLLEACYDLARGLPVQLPQGYVEVGRIEASAGDMASTAGDTLGAAAQAEAFAMAVATVNPDLFGFVVTEAATGSVLVCIRGTLVPEEWLRNFTAVPVGYDLVSNFGLVHLGFREMYRKVRDSVFQHLGGVDAHARITIVGHSLGGAMGIVAAPDIVRNLGKQVVDVCTVGGPRVGKPDFRDSFNALIPECFRVTNQFDIVPHVPTLVTGWRHTGEEVEVDGNVSSPHSLAAYLAGLRALAGLASFGLDDDETVTFGLTARDNEERRVLGATVP